MIYSVLLTLSLVGILAGLIYVFLVWNFDYWKKRGVKGPKPKVFYGSFPNMIRRKRHTVYDIQDIYMQYRHDEDFIGVFSIRTPQLMILNPELALKVLVTNFKNFRDNELISWIDLKKDKLLAMNPFMLRGDDWKERRQEISSGLTANKIRSVYPVIQQGSKDVVRYIKERCTKADGNGLDCKDIGLRFASDVVTDCALGIKTESLSDNPTPILDRVSKIFQEIDIFTIYAFLVGLWPTIRSFYKRKIIKTDSNQTFFVNLMKSAIDIRHKQSVDRMDFLNYLLQLQQKKNLPIEQITSHMMTLMLDGFETTGILISHCLYELAKKPSTQEKLREAILSNLNENGELDIEKLHDIHYLDQCLHETMRMTPPQLFSTRVCTEAYEFTNKNGNKLQMKPDDIVLIPFYAFHNDEQYYPNPDEFIPERFSPENGGVNKFREMGVFFPFGDGPRICAGIKFALTINKAAVAEIVKNFNIKLNPKTRTDHLLQPEYFIGSLEGGVWLDFEERK